MFSTLYGTYFSFQMHFNMLTAICFNLDQSKTLWSGNSLLQVVSNTGLTVFNVLLWLTDCMVTMLSSTVFQLYGSCQCSYPCFPGVLLTSTPHNNFSKPLAVFPHNHFRNNKQGWQRNESCDQSLERILAEPGIEPVSCSHVCNGKNWDMGLGVLLWYFPNSFPHENLSHMSQPQRFVDAKWYVAKIVLFVFYIVENIVGKGENAGH